MSHITNKLTMAVAGLAVASLPVLVDAQSTPQTRPQTTPQTRTRSSDPSSPQHHLDEARRVLTSLNANSIEGETRSKVNELKRHFMQLESAWRTSSAGAAQKGASRTTDPAPNPTTATGTTGTPEETRPKSEASKPASGGAAAAGDWMTHYTAITKLLDPLIGTSASASADVKLDANVRARLTEFKRHLDLFHETAMASSGRGEEDAASANPHSGVTGAMTGTGSAASRPAPTAATGTTASTPPPSNPVTGSPETPEATAGTSAAARAQATPPTTQPTASSAATVDAAAIARLTASIDEMLRGGAATSVTAGTTGSTTSATAGTTGTTSSTGTVCVDRAKLEELKAQLQTLQNRPR